MTGKTLIMKSGIQSFFKCWAIYILPVLFSAQIIAQPAPKLEDMSVCYEGDAITIASECDDCTTKKCTGYFVFNKSKPENLIWISAYNLINFAEDKSMMVELVKHNSNDEEKNPRYYERAVINVKTGEYIIPFGVQYIQYVFEDRLFVVNKDNRGNLIDTYGKKLNKDMYGYIGYIAELGYFNKPMYDEQEIIFDKNESPLLTFKNFNISEAIDAHNFIARPNEGVPEDIIDGTYIIDREENILFYDQYGEVYTQEDSIGNRNVIGYGLEDTDDSYSLLIQNKKGKWYNPMFKFLSNHYVNYISTVCLHLDGMENTGFHKNKEVFCYVSGFEYDSDIDKGYLLDTKGNVIIEVEGSPRFNAVHFNSYYNKKAYPFIYFFLQYSSESFTVYDEDGSILLEHPDNYENYMPEEINEAGYYSFINETLDETYLFNAQTKQMVTLTGKVTFSNLEDVEKHF